MLHGSMDKQIDGQAYHYDDSLALCQKWIGVASLSQLYEFGKAW